MNNKKVICDNCRFYFNEIYLHKNKNGKNYCNNCQLITSGISPSDIKPISKKDLDKAIKAAINTPPLKLKDLKAKLKKEREEKQKFRDKKSSK